MVIYVNGVESTFHRSVQNIIHLFFEEVNVTFIESSKTDLFVDITMIDEIESTSITVRLKDPLANKSYEAYITKSLDPTAIESDRRKALKHIMNQPILQVFEQYSGLKQPWGVLTGIRPTKLLHQKLKSGITKERAHAELKEQYKIHDEKIKLMQTIVDRQKTMVPDLYDLRSEVSIYIGIPFCPTKCAYCTFPAYAINGKQGSVDSFLGGLHYEMRQVGSWLKKNNMKITTVYFGGGTPTSITAEEMDLLYEEMVSSFPHVDEIREITVEAGRPDTITEEKLEILKKWNIDRISINPQSYTQDTLKAIGRHHSVEETIDKFHLARNMGMNNINMDLIIGLPGEGMKHFNHTLNETEKLIPESLTIHTLSFKRASEMTQNKNKYKVADRKEVTEMMKRGEEWTNNHGYVPYYLYRQKNILGNLENVGYAHPGQESIYNIMIMEEQQTIIGLGCGASSKWIDPVTGKITRFANPKEPKAYNDHYKKYTEAKIKTLNELFAKEIT
ncbi:coproporphyrinogen III oxidase [Chengkuizengella axinellae]|uniref:Coproporphyrinogen III oxidase n=1 Tax=Chengkuizengella axinellae TaxID=3064388 RepID=A0ABT9ITU9_9BACL|nr:coproporphyrinogen III oxidase [Chengkuizengella sp. 2205SS18-9]MDP5272779.1 coproporphyrinogen III oxidase [Chengkuizengella sp. 2205SS18-9]